MSTANNHLLFSAVFVLALIFSHGIISTEQRFVKKRGGEHDIGSRRNISEDEKSHGLISAGKSPSFASISAQDSFRPLTPGHIYSPPSVPRVTAESDDFRPTTPGHSPGAGHSTGPSSAGPN